MRRKLPVRLRSGQALRRWLTFNAVGAIGVALQLGVLALLFHVGGLHYLAATVIAVEAAILHNFVWHQRWTWRDRPAGSRRELAARLGRFHLLNGTVSLVGNVLAMAALTGGLGMEPALANVLAIATCSLVNFALSTTLVFRTATATAAALALFAAAPSAAWAGPTTEAAAAWKAYESRIDGRFAAPSGPYFVLDSLPEARGWRDAARTGVVKMSSVQTPSAKGAQIHHWVGGIFVPGARLDDVLAKVRRSAGNESAFYDDVVASRLLGTNGDRWSVFLKLRREAVITVTYNTEHAVEYRRLDSSKANVRSVSTKIAELDRPGTPREREKADGDDNGFLWRLNAYWRYEQLPDGVLIECESLSLSRHIPALLRPIAGPIVDSIARESLEKTLRELRAFLTAPAGARR